MFTTQLSNYLNLDNSSIKPRIIVDTKNFYEFSMQALLIADDWYVIISDPDPSRIDDIDEVIEDEFNAKTIGWCVLKEHQDEFAAPIIPFDQGNNNFNKITFTTKGFNLYWLLKIKPYGNSRLNQLSSSIKSI